MYTVATTMPTINAIMISAAVDFRIAFMNETTEHYGIICWLLNNYHTPDADLNN